MPELIVCVGAMASGKSTWAKQYCADNPGSVRVERDYIRQLINAPFPTDEGAVTKTRDTMIREFLMRGLTVISSDVNLSHKTRAQIEAIASSCGAPVYYKLFTDVPLDVCLARNAARPPETFIPEQTIRNLHRDCITSGKFMKNIDPEKVIQ